MRFDPAPLLFHKSLNATPWLASSSEFLFPSPSLPSVGCLARVAGRSWDLCRQLRALFWDCLASPGKNGTDISALRKSCSSCFLYSWGREPEPQTLRRPSFMRAAFVRYPASQIRSYVSCPRYLVTRLLNKSRLHVCTMH